MLNMENDYFQATYFSHTCPVAIWIKFKKLAWVKIYMELLRSLLFYC